MLGLDAHRVPDHLLLSWSPRGFQLDFLEVPWPLEPSLPSTLGSRRASGVWPLTPPPSHHQLESGHLSDKPPPSSLPLPMLPLLSLVSLYPPSGPSLGAPLQRFGSPRPPLPSLYRIESQASCWTARLLSLHGRAGLFLWPLGGWGLPLSSSPAVPPPGPQRGHCASIQPAGAPGEGAVREERAAAAGQCPEPAGQGGLAQRGSAGNSEEYLRSRYIVSVEPTGLEERLDMGWA